MRMTRLARMGLTAMLVLSANACGDSKDDTGGAANGGATVGDKTSAMIVATAGGTLELGAASLTIPAGALAEDLEVTVEVVSKKGKPDEANIAAAIYDFGPDGTTFEKPVTLSFDFAGAVPEGKAAKVAWLEDGAWKIAADSKVSGKTVSATTLHFTPFTVIFASTGEQIGGACGSNFTACGGDLTGKWKFTGSCATVPNGLDPFGGMCAGLEAAFTVDVTGTVEFADGQLTSMQTISSSATFTIPKQCFVDQAMGQITLAQVSCDGFADDVGDDDEAPTTAEDTGTACKISQPQQSKQEDNTDTYTVDGDVVTFGEDEPSEFCVRGDVLTVRTEDSEGTVIQYTAERQ